MQTTGFREQMLANVVVTRRTIDVDGIATAVLEAGSGSPLLLLHGAIECGGAMWAPVITPLAARHRLVIPDAPGLGESAPVDRLDVTTFTRWFEALLRVTDLERPALVAHSLFGSMAVHLAARRSELVSQVVAYGAPGVGPYRMPMALRYAAIRFAIRPTAANAERFDRFALLDVDATRGLDPDWYEAFSLYTRERAGRRAVKRTMNSLISPMTKQIPEADLDRIECPVSLLWGRHDRMVPLSIAEHASSRRGWPLHVVEAAAHAPHIEAPRSFPDVLESALAT